MIITMDQVLVIGAGQFQLSGIRKLKEKNYYVIGIDGDNKCVGRKFCDEFYNIDIKDYKQILDLIEKKNFNLVGCISFATEYALRTVALINDKLGLNGLTISDVSIATSKIKQREILKSLDIPSPKFFYLNLGENVEDKFDANQLMFPCVVKPSDSAGSRGVNVVKNKAQLQNAIKEARKFSSFDAQIIVEEMIEGIEFTVESFVYNGEIKTLAISEKKKPLNNHTVSTELFYNSPLVNNLGNIIEETVTTFIKACNFKNTITHTEVIYSYKDHKVYIIETTTRSGGFGVFDKVLPFVTGLDIVGLSIDLSLGNQISIDRIQKNPCILRFFSANEGKLINIVEMESIIKGLNDIEFGFFVNIGDNIGVMVNDGSRIGYLISYGRSWEEVYNKANILEYSIRFEVLSSLGSDECGV